MKSKHKYILFRIIMASILLLLGFLLKLDRTIYNDIIFSISYVIIGYDVIIKAFRNIVRGKILDENFLMSVATIGAFLIDEIPEAVAVMLFYQVGELFQSYAVEESRKSIANLMDIRPDFANVYRNGNIDKVSPEEVKIGEIILVKPGEKIPLDGIIIEGTSSINALALTGEAIPQQANIGDAVLSGTIAIDGILKIEVNKRFEESTVSKILELVENASDKKSKSEQFITKFARYYTPIVVIVALLLAIFPPLIIPNATHGEWVYRALSFLVVSCPCALVISVPLSFFGGIGASSRAGILIKGSNYLEALSSSEILACDKTGTLTEGVFKVQKIEPVAIPDNELLKYAVYAEYYSLHPISISLKEAYNQEVDESLITKTYEIAGKGIEAIIDGHDVLVGNEKLMNGFKIKFTPNNNVGTIIYIAIDKKYSGSIVIADKVKEDTYKTLTLLRKKGIQKIIMLTGDRQNISESIASKLSIDECYSELLPQDKVNIVESILKKKSSPRKLLFVGDGINDAPVLALADVGIAMGGIGSDAAIEAADIVIMTDELSKIATAITIAKKTMRIVKENITFAITVKVGILILSAIGIANMWSAVFADVGVTVLAVLNALRILRFKSEKR